MAYLDGNMQLVVARTQRAQGGVTWLDGNMQLVVARAQRAQGGVVMGGWDGRLGKPHSKQDLDLEKGVEVLFTVGKKTNGN